MIIKYIHKIKTIISRDYLNTQSYAGKCDILDRARRPGNAGSGPSLVDGRHIFPFHCYWVESLHTVQVVSAIMPADCEDSAAHCSHADSAYGDREISD
jgi:hypothetical protein